MYDQIRRNKINSAILLCGMALVLCLLGYFLAEAFAGQGSGPIGVVVAVVVWIIMVLVATSSGDSIVLSMAGARKIEKADAPQLFNVVEEMTIASGLPAVPDIYIIDNDAPNAFAVGKPGKCAVAVTSGLLMQLNRDELQGVIAHEIGHIHNTDTRFMVLAGVTVGAIVLLADMGVRAMWVSGGSRRSSSREGGGQGQAIIMIIALVLAILAPILAQLLYFACSRKREYLADASSALFTRYPAGLASALAKISAAAPRMAKSESVNRVTAPMYIVNPLAAAGSSFSVFSTHPPTEDRIRVLRSMASGASYGDYEKAFESVHEGRPVMSMRTVEQAALVGLRAPSADAQTAAPAAKTREAVDILHRLNQYLFMACACGLKMKLPPGFNQPQVQCPRCGRINPVPVAAISAAAAAGGQLTPAGVAGLAGQAIPGVAAPPLQRTTPKVTLRREGWQSFRCSCGQTIQIGPTFSAPTVQCRKCGQVTEVERI